MKTTDLQQEFINDEFHDTVLLAGEIIGAQCSDTVMRGDPDKGDDKGTKYQITADPYSVADIDARINLGAFENYFYANFGKWKDRCYFDTPAQAFVALIKAWRIWNNELTLEFRRQYLEPMERLHRGL